MKSKLCKLFIFSKLGLILLLLAGCNGMALKKSMPANFKTYGHKTVSSKEHPVRSGDNSRRFEVRAGDCSWTEGWNDCKNDRERHELKSTTFSDGEYWFNWSLYLPDDFPIIFPVKVALGQFHQEQGHPVWMFQNSKGGYNVDNQVSGGTIHTRKVLTDQEMRGRWSDILVHVNFTADKDGFFRVYVNGETSPRYAWSGPTKTAGKRVYYKTGIYRSFMSRSKGPDATQVVYFDDLAKAKNCSQVSKYFDCSAIEAKQSELVNSAILEVCGDRLCPPVYDRSTAGLTTRFECWLTQSKAQGKNELPSNHEVQNLISSIEGDKYYMLKSAIRTKGVSQQSMKVHSKAISQIVNFASSNQNYCNKI